MILMNKPTISPDFNVEDIRMLRDYNSSRHAKMSVDEIREDMRPNVEAFEKLMAERKREKQFV
jgi:hypothetical protein